MIEATKAFKTSDGQTHATIADAKRHELVALFDDSRDFGGAPVKERVATAIVANQDKIIEILKTKERIRAKKGTGTRKSRKGNQPTLLPQ